MPEPFIKDPNAILDYKLDYGAYLETGETISTSTWTASTGITVQSSTNTATTATVWLAGGTVNGGEEIGVNRGVAQRAFRVTNRITTSAGRTDDRSIFVAVVER